jgi:hypothetical protein
MKKVYLSIFLAGLGCNVSYGQFAQKAFVANDINRSTPKPTSEAPTQKALGTTFWTNNFSTPSDWTVNNSGQAGAEFGWTIDNVADGWWAPASAIASTSEGNFAELSNGDPTLPTPNQALGVVYTMTTSAPIDLTTNGTNISLQFQQFGARFNDLQEIQVSTDGITFFAVGNNSDFSVLSQAGGSAYPNPSLKSVNLAPFLSGATQVWIRFSWTTNFPSQASNANVWITYGWYIDDVTLTTNADFDLNVTSTYWGSVGLNYSQIPLLQVAPIDFSANVFNGGTQAMNNTVLNVDVNAGAWTGTSSATTIASLASDSLALTTQFTPSNTATATYSVVRNLTSTDADDVPANNAMSTLSFATTNFLYARDFGTPAGSTSNGTDGFETGNLFDIYQPQTVTAINTRLLGGTGGTTVGTEVFAKLYSVDPTTGDFVYVSESNPIVIAAGNLNTTLILPLISPVDLLPNTTYLAVVGSFGTGLKVANAGSSYDQTTFLLDMLDGTWYYQTATPVVRLNFDPSSSIEENTSGVAIGNVYPNPTSGTTTIAYTLANASTVSFSVVDITGKTVYTAANANQVAGAHQISFDAATFANGVYYITIGTEGTTVTKKFIKK